MYPPLARQARVSGTLITSVQLDRDAKVISISHEAATGVRSAAGLLAPGIGNSSSCRAAFARACGERALTFIFQFVITNGTPSDDPKPIISFGYPNRFTISVLPPYCIPI